MRLRTPLLSEPSFVNGGARPKLLIEDPDAWAYADHFEGAGFDVALCAGPQPEGDLCSRCPLVAEGVCEAVEYADVILSSLPGDVGKPVVSALALRSRHAPLVLHVPAPKADEYRALLPAATVVPFPASVDELESAVRKAVA